ncbi:glycerol-3-phosphate 1-O-acyltransferase [Nocardia sp. NPDC088792]|uniref:glycerol-3-phosphate 1-O-acyltransferase n=1 Tax=Nocardia sp. NPDC088792 TaxID=3364332 RepID=UPI003802BB89
MPADIVAEDRPCPVVVLVDASSVVERELIDGWIAEGGPAAEYGFDTPVVQLAMDAFAVASRLVGRRDDPVVVPVRVIWLPPEREGVRRTTFADLATLTDPRKPRRFMQRRLLAKAPDRHLVVAGRPARLSELRARNLVVAGATELFARAIVRDGIVALERAQRAAIGNRYKVPRLIAEEVLDTPEFRDRLEAIAADTGAEVREVFGRAEEALRELVAGQSPLVSDLFTQAMRPLHASAWKIDCDRSGLAGLRELNNRHPLVFLPSHRSYMDPFVLGDALARNDFPPNHVVGGVNLSFWPMGVIARRTGKVFIRRSFGDDQVYKAAVEAYFAYLLAKRFNLEWYFEGGRTRTGKLRQPRLGLLNYLAAAIRAGRVDDVMLVPVSITYERLNELDAIATEQVGGVKKPEGLAFLARYLRSQQRSAGHVYVRFGTPQSARGRLTAHGDPQCPGPGPVVACAPSEQGQEAVRRLARDVAVGINAVTPITVNALATLALLGVHECALTLGEVRRVVEPVLGYIAHRGLPQGKLDTLRDDRGLAGVLEQLSMARVVTVYREGVEPVYSIQAGAHLKAAFYRNSAVHWFVNRAILELAVLAAVEAPEGDQLRAGRAAAYRMRELLKFEFLFPGRAEFSAQLASELLLVDPQWLRRSTTTGADVLTALSRTGFIMAHRVLRSFFDAQLVLAERLAARDPAAPVDRTLLIDECVSVGRQMFLQQRLHSPESVSSELFATALRLADDLGLLDAERADVGPRRQAFAEELRTIGARIARAAAMDPSTPEQP